LEDTNRLAQEAIRDGCWVEMRLRKEELNTLASGERRITQHDFLAFFQCLTLVLTEISLYEKDFVCSDGKIGKLLFDKSPEGAFLRIIEEASLWKFVEEDNSQEDKLKTLEKLRECVWGSMVPHKDKLIQLVRKFPHMNDTEDMALLFQCVSLIIVQLEIKEKEIEILEDN